jgi:hypothetical protein
MKSADIQRSGSLRYDKGTGHRIARPEITEGVNENLVPEIAEEKPNAEKPVEEKPDVEKPGKGGKTP